MLDFLWGLTAGLHVITSGCRYNGNLTMQNNRNVLFSTKRIYGVYILYIYIYMYVYITIHQNTYIVRRWGNINKFAGVELDCVKFSRHPVDIVVSHVDIGSRYPK